MSKKRKYGNIPQYLPNPESEKKYVNCIRHVGKLLLFFFPQHNMRPYVGKSVSRFVLGTAHWFVYILLYMCIFRYYYYFFFIRRQRNEYIQIKDAKPASLLHSNARIRVYMFWLLSKKEKKERERAIEKKNQILCVRR